MLALSYLPEYWKHDRIRKLIDYFLLRDGIFKRTNLKEFVNKDMQRNSFPIIWRANVFEILLALSKMGYGKDSRLQRAWDFLDTKADKNESTRFGLDSRTVSLESWEKKSAKQVDNILRMAAHKFKECGSRLGKLLDKLGNGADIRQRRRF